jgi:hypothetical protein
MFRGWPYLFVETTRDMAAGDEVLVSYGAAYWDEASRTHSRLIDDFVARVGELAATL